MSSDNPTPSGPDRDPASGSQRGGTSQRSGLRGRIPEWLRPLSQERRGRGELRIVETFVLSLVGLVLIVATVHDLGREVRIGDRLSADLASWRELTRPYYPDSYYHNVLIEQDIKKYTTRDVVCANPEYVKKPENTVQICFIFTGPVEHGRRQAKGGYYLVALGKDVHEPVINLPKYSYGCFGTAVAEHLCLGTRPAGKPDQPLLGGA